MAACKVIAITEQSTEKERKTIEKEMRVHAALKHDNVLEFLNAVVVELKHKHLYVPGIYMLMELAAGGDLFDKIGNPNPDLYITLVLTVSLGFSSRCRLGRRSGTLLFQPTSRRDGEWLRSSPLFCIIVRS